MPDSGRSDHDVVRVRISLPPPTDGWPPLAEEFLWAIPLSERRYRIDNIPFFAVGVNYRDIVSLRNTRGDGVPTVDAVVERGGHATFRIQSPHTSDPEKHEMFHHLVDALKSIGCLFESNTSTYFAVDVPPETDCERAFQIMALGEQWDVWSFGGGPCPEKGPSAAGG